MRKKVAVLLAEGFEEIEAVIPIDVLRRLDVEVVTAAVGDKPVGAHNLAFEADCRISDLAADELDALILPGGMPGSTNLMASAEVISLVRDLHSAGKIVAAICAAPIVLAKAGIMAGKTCTGYPMALVKEALANADYTGEKTERDGNIVTGKGPGAAFEFALEVAAALGLEPEARQLMKSMFVK